MKKVIALVLALAMVLAVAVASAHTISVKDTDTHEYRVFQVLKGTLSEAGSKELGDATWGDDVIAEPGSVADFIADITTSGLTQKEIAEKVAAKVNTSGTGRGTVKKDAPLTDLPTGYYVLVDITELADESKETLALHVVEVLNDINGLTIKYDSTSDDKIISTDTLGKDAGEGTNEINGKTDNVSIGDTVNYEITAKVPSNADLYNYFYFVINDTLDAGLTFTDGSINVYKDSVDDANKLTLTTDYLLKTGNDADPHTFEIGLVDARSLKGKDIIVTYSAVVNENAEIGETPNKNTSTVIFSNDPNHTYDGDNHPGFPADDEDGALGETPETRTETYTTGIEIQKVDQDGKVLTGATFEISGKSTKTVLTVAETFVADEAGEYWKLKDGTYTKDAPTADGEYMKEAAAGATAGYVVDNEYNGDDKKVIDGVTYRPYVPETDAGKTIYVLTTGNADLYEGNTKYKKTVDKTPNDVTSNHTASMAVNENGLARFDGLGAGTYTIHESKTPQGYNTIPDLKVTISFDADGTPKWSFSSGGVYDSDEGIYKITIKNNKGTELPSTGGIGTTIFYILGGLLVVGAVVILVARRKAQD